MSQTDNDKLKKSKPGETQEDTNSTTGLAGLYRHPNGEELITLYDPLYGDAQSEAAIRVGFEFVREAKPEEIKTIVTGTQSDVANQTAATVNGGVSLDDLKGIQARISAVEAETKAKDDEILALKQALAAKNEQGETKVEAQVQTEGRLDGAGQAGGVNPNDQLQTGGVVGEGENDENDGDEGDDEGEGGEELPVVDGNTKKEDLLKIATEEGVELTPELDTNKKLVEAIKANREAKKGE